MENGEKNVKILLRVRPSHTGKCDDSHSHAAAQRQGDECILRTTGGHRGEVYCDDHHHHVKTGTHITKTPISTPAMSASASSSTSSSSSPSPSSSSSTASSSKRKNSPLSPVTPPQRESATGGGGGGATSVHDHVGAQKFSFTDVLWYVQQEEVYEQVDSDFIQASIRGQQSSCILAYGQTGSGKTYTIFGNNMNAKDNDNVYKSSTSTTLSEDFGIVPRISKSICTLIRQVKTKQVEDIVEYSVSLSLLEIYMDKVNDLFDLSKTNLSIRESRGTTLIPNLTELKVKDDGELWPALRDALAKRTTASTRMNHESSRSHCVLKFKFNGTETATGQAFESHLFIVDLAGSEKFKQTGTSGSTMDEAKYINSSLTALGKVIEKIAKSQTSKVLGSRSKDGSSGTVSTNNSHHHNNHIPYRDSKLTRILQPALTHGHTQTKTCVILCCNAIKENFSETMSTLRFGATMSVIKQKLVSANDNKKEKQSSEIEKLQSEMSVLVSEQEAFKQVIRIMRHRLFYLLLPVQVVITLIFSIGLFLVL